MLEELGDHPKEVIMDKDGVRGSGFFDAAEEIMHFINSLDSEGMDANAVRSAIYHKCFEMRPRTTPQGHS